MPFVILTNAVMGLVAAFVYHPDSPLYRFGQVRPEELWLWAKYAGFMAALLFIFALLAVDSDNRGRGIARGLSAFVAALQGILNLPPAIMYVIFLHGSPTADLTVRGQGLTISSTELLLHVAIIAVSWLSAAWLIWIRDRYPDQQESDISDSVQLTDLKAS